VGATKTKRGSFINMQTYLACFDISDDKQRRKISRRLEHFGLRVQYSVFEVSIKNDIELEQLKEELQQWVDTFDDIRFYHLCSSCRDKSHRIGEKPIAEFPLAVVI